MSQSSTPRASHSEYRRPEKPNRIVPAETRRARLVYNRKKHPFNIYRVARIALVEYNQEKFDEDHFAPWNQIALLGERVCTTIITQHAIILRPDDTSRYITVVKFHYYLKMLKEVADKALPNVPFVGQVWGIGGPLIDWCIESLSRIVGNYHYDPAKDVVTFL